MDLLRSDKKVPQSQVESLLSGFLSIRIHTNRKSQFHTMAWSLTDTIHLPYNEPITQYCVILRGLQAAAD